ncbi:hypothetical protein [Neisseria sp. Ec49-e6-T10]
MSKHNQSNKENKKSPLLNAKEKRAKKQLKKQELNTLTPLITR